MTRDEAIWYYVLGGQTLGPVPWSEIEALTRDTVDAQDLLVARGGASEWRSAAQTLAEFPELAPEAAEPEPIPGFEMPAAPAAMPAAPAAPPVSAVAPGVGGAFVPGHGLGQWLGQAWEMVILEVWPWVGAMALMMLVSMVTLGIAGPPLMTGLYMMALKRFRGEPIGAGDVFGGFSRFLSSWGLNLVMMIPAVIVIAPLMILMVIPMMTMDGGGEMDPAAALGLMSIYVLAPLAQVLVLAVQAIFFYSWVLVAEGYGAWESVTMSWEKIRENYWSYLGMYLVLSIIAGLGSYACYVGLFVTWPLLPCAQVATYMWHFGTRRAEA